VLLGEQPGNQLLIDHVLRHRRAGCRSAAVHVRLLVLALTPR
jgi:hypothetical protein